MSEEQLNASLDAEDANLAEEGAAEDVELTDEELAGVAGGARTSYFDLDSDFGEVNPFDLLNQ
jgi:hypothetical protein